MSSLGEIEEAINILELAGTPRAKITVLHCNTEYPTPLHDVNLLAMNTIKQAFEVNVGYSDHTLGIEVSIAAVALGASVIEKHITLDKSKTGPDHIASIEPLQFKQMVKCIRNVEIARGSRIKNASPSEMKNKLIARKSIVAIKPIALGEQYTSQNLGVKRPGNGINPMNWNLILGKYSNKSYEIGRAHV